MDSEQPSLQEIYKQQASAVERESRSEWAQSLAKHRKALQEDSRSPEAYVEAARCHKKLGEHEDAIDLLQKGIRCCAPSMSLYRWCINLCEECNRTGEA